MTMTVGELEVKIFANLAQLSTDMNKAKQMVGDSMGAISKSVEVAKKALEALGIGMGVYEIKEFVNRAIEAGDSMYQLSLKVGMSVESLSKYKLAADQSGLSMEQMGMGMKNLSVYMAKHGSQLASIGVTSKDVNVAFKQFADVIAGMPEGYQRTALAMEVMKRAGMNMIPLLVKGSEGIDKAAAASEAYSQKMTKLAPAANAFKDKMAELALVGGGVGVALATGLIDPLNELAETLLKVSNGTNVMDRIASSIKPIIEMTASLMTGSFEAIANNFNLLASAVIGVTTAFLAYRIALKAEEVWDYVAAHIASTVALRAEAEAKLYSAKTSSMLATTNLMMLESDLAILNVRRQEILASIAVVSGEEALEIARNGLDPINKKIIAEEAAIAIARKATATATAGLTVAQEGLAATGIAGMLGGMLTPIGWITAALGVGAAAWSLYSMYSSQAGDAVSASADKQVEAMQRIKQEQDTLSVNVAARKYVIGLGINVNDLNLAQAEIDKIKQLNEEIVRLQTTNMTMVKNQAGGFEWKVDTKQALLDIGVAQKEIDKIVAAAKTFKNNKSQADAIDKMLQHSKDSSSEEAAAKIAALDNIAMVSKSHNDVLMAQLDDMLKHNLLSYRDYYAEKGALEDAADKITLDKLNESIKIEDALIVKHSVTYKPSETIKSLGKRAFGNPEWMKSAESAMMYERQQQGITGDMGSDTEEEQSKMLAKDRERREKLIAQRDVLAQTSTIRVIKNNQEMQASYDKLYSTEQKMWEEVTSTQKREGDVAYVKRFEENKTTIEQFQMMRDAAIKATSVEFGAVDPASVENNIKIAKAYDERITKIMEWIELESKDAQLTGDTGRANQELAEQQKRNNLGVTAGIESQYDATSKLIGIEKSRIPELQRIANESKKLYDSDPSNDKLRKHAIDAQLAVDELNATITSQDQMMSAGFNRGLVDYYNSAIDGAKNMQSAVTNAFKGMEDALVTFVTTGKLDFHSLAQSIIADLVRISIQQNITAPLAKMGSIWMSNNTTGGGFGTGAGGGGSGTNIGAGGLPYNPPPISAVASGSVFDRNGRLGFSSGGIFNSASYNPISKQYYAHGDIFNHPNSLSNVYGHGDVFIPSNQTYLNKFANGGLFNSASSVGNSISNQYFSNGDVFNKPSPINQTFKYGYGDVFNSSVNNPTSSHYFAHGDVFNNSSKAITEFVYGDTFNSTHPVNNYSKYFSNGGLFNSSSYSSNPVYKNHFARGDVFSDTSRMNSQISNQKFAGGGTFTNQIFKTVTPFMFAKGGSMHQGIMGEAGAEAVMPLKHIGSQLGVQATGADGKVTILPLMRGTDGKLGVNINMGSTVGESKLNGFEKGDVFTNLNKSYFSNGSVFNSNHSAYSYGEIFNSVASAKKFSGGDIFSVSNFAEGDIFNKTPSLDNVSVSNTSSSVSNTSPASIKGGDTHVTYSPEIHIDSRTDQQEVYRLVMNSVRQGQAELVDRLERQRRL